MAWRWSWLIIALALLPLAAAANHSGEVILFDDPAWRFTVTEQDPSLKVQLSDDKPYQRVTVDFDMEFTGWRADAPADVHEYFLVHLHSTPGGVPKAENLLKSGFWISGMTIRGRPGGWKTALDPYGGPEPVPTKVAQWSPGKYHVRMITDGLIPEERVIITKDGKPFQEFAYPLAAVPERSRTPLSQVLSDGLYLKFGIDKDIHGYHLRPFGFTFSGLRVTAIEGFASNESGGAAGASPQVQQLLKQADGFEPETDDPQQVVLHTAPGTFFQQPFGTQCESHGRSCAAEKWFDLPNGTAYEKVTVSFEFTTHDLERAGYWQHLVSLRSTCSNKQFYDFTIKQASQESWTAFTVRGSPNILYGKLNYQEMTTYRAEITFDIRDQEAYVRIYDSGGQLLQTVGDRINADPSNKLEVRHTLDGLTLVFGLSRNYPGQIYGQPHLWKFSNLNVTAVPLGSGPIEGPGGADLSSDDGRLAFLAASMLNITSGEFSLDCGPAAEVLNVPPSVPPEPHGASYCVLRSGDDVAFGTFGSGAANVSSLLLASYNDINYEAQIPQGGVKAEACNGIDAFSSVFQPCPDALEGQHTYALIDAASQTTFLIVSSSDIDVFDTGIFDGIMAFFSRLFDDGSPEPPLRRMHRGYFAQAEGREIAAAWNGDDAMLRYRGFVTDLNRSRPQGARYAKGQEGQVLMMELDPESPADATLWRRLTAALRIADVEGEPVMGGQCGDGVIDYGEQCDTGVAAGTCAQLYPGVFSGNEEVACSATCTLDLTPCLGSSAGTCRDDWTPPPSAHSCPGDPACPAGGGGGGQLDPCASLQCDAGLVCRAGECVDPGNLPACPTEWKTAATQGAYEIKVRSDEQGRPWILFVPDKDSPYYTYKDGEAACELDSRSGSEQEWRTGSFGPHQHQAGQTTVVYHRQKSGSSVEIILYHKENGWEIVGDPTPEGGNDGDSSPASYCWCPAGDSTCSSMRVEIPLSGVPACNPDAQQGAQSCTGASGCCRISESCSADAQCCGFGERASYCSAGRCAVGYPGEGRDPERDEQFI